MRKSLRLFLAATSLFLPNAIGQSQTKSAKPDGLCLAEDKPNRHVYVAIKDTKRQSFDLKPGDVYIQVADDAVVVYTAEGKKKSFGMIPRGSGEIEKEMLPELAKYRHTCGIKQSTPNPK